MTDKKSRNVQLTGIWQLMYLKDRFNCSVVEAYSDMVEHKQDVKDIELMFLEIYDFLSHKGNLAANEFRAKHIKEYI